MVAERITVGLGSGIEPDGGGGGGSSGERSTMAVILGSKLGLRRRVWGESFSLVIIGFSVSDVRDICRTEKLDRGEEGFGGSR